MKTVGIFKIKTKRNKYGVLTVEVFNGKNKIQESTVMPNSYADWFIAHSIILDNGCAITNFPRLWNGGKIK